jgi:hypothetical protein
MNIFYLSHDPEEAARFHCDKHVVKMILETAQMLSTAHRLLDGQEHQFSIEYGGRTFKKKMRLLRGETLTGRIVLRENGTPGLKLQLNNRLCYMSTHANHPSNVWLRETRHNYMWGSSLLQALTQEYERRYKRSHATARYLQQLAVPPSNLIKLGHTPVPLAMPEEYKRDDPVEAYRAYYRGDKRRFAVWRHSETPTWFNLGATT